MSVKSFIVQAPGDKHSSLLRTFVNYGRKKFYNNWSKVENEVDETTEKPVTLGQILTGDVPAATTAETKAPETEPVSTLPSTDSQTTTVSKQVT